MANANLVSKLWSDQCRDGIDAYKGRTTLVSYTFPTPMLPDFHHAVYQLIVGVEQGHSEERLSVYAKNLRKLADEAFVEPDKDQSTNWFERVMG